MDKGNNRISNWITVYWKERQSTLSHRLPILSFPRCPKNQANVTERLNDRKTTDDKGWTNPRYPQAQAVQELVLKSISLQDAIHPDDFK